MATPLARWDEKTIEKIARSPRPGVLLRQLLRSARRVERRRAAAALSPARQPALRLRVLDARGLPQPTVPPRGRVFESDFFVCRHFDRCLMEVRHCLERQGARWPGGNRAHKTHGEVVEKKAPIHPHCASGACEQGRDLAARCQYRPEDSWSKGRFSFYRKDSSEQRRAMRRARAVDQGAAAPEDPLRVAADMTPDDKLPL